VGIPAMQDVVLRIVSSEVPGRQGEELPFAGDAMTIGRADDCAIALPDHQVSRHHAKLERRGGACWIVDTGSANGVWVGTTRVTERLLSHGEQFRIGSTVFEFVAPPPVEATVVGVGPLAAEGTAVLEAPAEFIVKVTAAKGSLMTVGTEFRVAGGVATLGRGEDCTVPLKDNAASRHHARVELLADGRFRVADAGSANGVWIGERRIAEEVMGPGEAFRVGNTFFECQVVVVEPETDHTVMMSDMGELLARVAMKRIEDAGESVSIAGSQAILLDDPDFAYCVVSGKVEVFTVGLQEGRPLGARNHFLTVPAGEAFFGMPPDEAQESAFLATSKSGVDIRRIRREELTAMAGDAQAAKQVARLLDGWLLALSTRLTRDISSRPFTDVTLAPGAAASVGPGKRARPAEGVVWVDADPGRLLYIGLAALSPDEARAFPLTASAWVEPAGDGSEAVALTPRPTAGLLGGAELWPGLDYFHQVLCECEFINKRLALVDEVERQDQSARESAAALDAGMDAIGSVLAGQHTEPGGLARLSGGKPLVEACRMVGDVLGINIKSPADSKVERSFEDHLQAIASASRFRTRRVAMKGDWWNHDNGPLIAVVEARGTPVAMIPDGPRAYKCIDPVGRTEQRVTEALAETLGPFGYSFYRSFPSAALTATNVVKFGSHGLVADFRVLLIMGVTTGFLGAFTPYLTGQMIDSAIPQSNRGLLFQLSMGMLLATFATAAFKITQAFAVVRVESRMDYSLQAAVWDRLMDLPSAFFRRYGAGDLAQRAGGVDTIRSVVSRAGVGGILGSISSAAFLVLMATYSFKLTLVAIVITLVLVGFTTIGNYQQLKYQRVESTQQGAISSLVLQLIVGVAKVRVCAAENYAFKVWAQKFSTQKRTSFAIGRVTNVVGTVSSSFGVLSSLGLFAALYYMQLTAKPGEPPPFTTGEFVAFNGAFGSFVAAVQGLSDASLALLKAVPIFERLRPILDEKPETDESKTSPGKLRGEISVSRLHFRYVQDGPWIIKDVSFKIAPGEFVAFVGGSGCGKSTMLRLLLGFEKPASGSIYYDGQDLSTLDSRGVRQQLGVVLQESRVLPTDIFRNIVGTSAHTMDEAWEAATMAGLADDVKNMPMGMHTVVSEGGGTFSGGQRQRLLIARALINRPRVIFFDEATSALDNRAQKQVTESMDRLDATRIVIAHRLSTIVNANRIFYFEGGEIREQGSYAELMAKNGLFAQLARRQIV
jgi:NHLM bacteriocin system ABC transporter ATP-binding protein